VLRCNACVCVGECEAGQSAPSLLRTRKRAVGSAVNAILRTRVPGCAWEGDVASVPFWR
jgi:hypothetical protein